MARSDFYVYVLLDPRKPGRFSYSEWSFLFEPFYVGKGCGKRLRRHLSGSKMTHRANRAIAIRNDGLEPIAMRLQHGLEEAAAFDLEIRAISLIGRRIRKTGPLVNQQRGGNGYSRRRPRPATPEEVKKKISATMKGRPLPEGIRAQLRGRPSWNKGRQLSPEECEEMRRKRAKVRNPRGPKLGTEPWNKGKSMSAETYEKCARAMFKPGHVPAHKGKSLNVSEGTLAALRRHHENIRGKPLSDEHRQNLSRARKGQPNTKLKGRPRPPEVIAKIKATKALRRIGGS